MASRSRCNDREWAFEVLEDIYERFSAIAEQAHDPNFESDATRGISYANPKFYATLGYTPEDVLGRQITDFAWVKNEFPSRADLTGKR